MPSGPLSSRTPTSEADPDVHQRLDHPHRQNAAQLAGEQSHPPHRRQRQSVQETGLDVSREVGTGVHGREERPLDERDRKREGNERVGREAGQTGRRVEAA